jgi:hypothetical protein
LLLKKTTLRETIPLFPHPRRDSQRTGRRRAPPVIGTGHYLGAGKYRLYKSKAL